MFGSLPDFLDGEEFETFAQNLSTPKETQQILTLSTSITGGRKMIACLCMWHRFHSVDMKTSVCWYSVG